MAPRRSTITSTVAGLVLAGAVIALVIQVRGPGRPAAPNHEWFYDLNTGELFAVPLGTLPPVAAPSGSLPDGAAAGVRAYVYGCGSCDPAARFVAYLETYTDQARQRFGAVTRQGTTAAEMTGDPHRPVDLRDKPENMTGILVRRPADPDWTERASGPGAQEVATALGGRCPPGVFPRRCYPGQTD